MASPVEAQLILCDAAVANSSGKVHMLGAGWSLTGSPTAPQAVAVLLKVPWDRTNQKIPLRLELLDQDGQPVRVGKGDEQRPIVAEGAVEAGRPAGLASGSSIDASYVLNVQALPLTPGRYEWRLDVGGAVRTGSFTVVGRR